MNLAYTLINLANACTITSLFFPLCCDAESIFRKAIDISTVVTLTKLCIRYPEYSLRNRLGLVPYIFGKGDENVAPILDASIQVSELHKWASHLIFTLHWLQDVNGRTYIRAKDSANA
jgi:hypothetical protein